MVPPSRVEIASLFCARLDLRSPGGRSGASGALERLSAEGVGGILLFGGDAEETPRLLRDLRGPPPLVMADLETGLGAQVRGGTSFPPAMALGAAGGAELVRRVARATAVEARAAGIDVVLGPVLDVNSNPLNPIIGVRAFGDDPEVVAELGVAAIAGVREAGAIACGKHFPGHGDTDADSHIVLPVILRGPGSLRAIELPPFARAIGAGVDCMMTAHVALPSVTGGERIPASRSQRIVEGLLRGELGFDGAVLTDAMIMAGARSDGGEAEAVVESLAAGNDMVLAVEDLEGSIEAVRRALDAGTLGRGRIAASRERIERLWRRAVESPRPAVAQIGCRAHRELARQAAEAAVTAVRNRRAFFPLGDGTDDILLVYRDDDAAREEEGGEGGLERDLRARFPAARVLCVGPGGAGIEVGGLSGVECAGRLVAFVSSPVRAWRGVADLSGAGRAFLDALLRRADRTGMVSLGSPVLMRLFPWIDGYLCTYGGDRASRAAAVRAVAGEIPAPGRLPVSIPGLYPRGWGMGPDALRSGAPA